MQTRIFYLIFAQAHSKWSYFIGLKIEKLKNNIKDDLLLKSKLSKIIVVGIKWNFLKNKVRYEEKLLTMLVNKVDKRLPGHP